MKTFFAYCAGLLLFLWLIVALSGSYQGLQPLKLNGHFDDWQGRTFYAKEQSAPVGQQLATVFWGTNYNEQKLYFMVERFTPTDPYSQLTYRIYFDINNNGSYEDGVDKYVEAVYTPIERDSGKVELSLHSVTGKLLASYQGMWGDGYGEGGIRHEFAIPMANLGIVSSQTINFYLSGVGNAADRLPRKGDITWSPFPVTTHARVGIITLFLLWFAVLAYFRYHRNWIFYYIWGSVGFSFVLILTLRGSPVEAWVEQQIGAILHTLSGYIGIPTRFFPKEAGSLLVLNDVNHSWTTIAIDLERSSLLEISILLGLLLFYPAYRPVRKLTFLSVGAFVTFWINILSLMVVIITIHLGGRSMIFVAHTLFARLLFFVLVTALYWQLFTKPSLKIVRTNVNNG